MSSEYLLEILTPAKEVFSAEVSEVVLPAYDGERGILADHEDLVGLLGTGPVKIVKGGDDYWFMVSSGVFEVKGGSVVVYAELAEIAGEFDSGSAQEGISAFEKVFGSPETYDPETYPAAKLEYDRNRARLEIHRRTDLVN